MKYDIDYINIKYSLLNALLIKASKGILDVSYNKTGTEINIQIVLLKGTFLNDEIKKKVRGILSEYDIKITELYLTKEQFNENKGEWNPKYYQWLDCLLFSKAEVL